MLNATAGSALLSIITSRFVDKQVRRDRTTSSTGYTAATARAGNLVIFVGVYCPLEELERREKARGDRKPGQARIQFEQVHAQALYDVKVDTSVLSSDACAARVVSYMRSEHDTSAFAQLRELHLP